MGKSFKKMNIPFVNLKFQYKFIKPSIDAAIRRVVLSQDFILGSELDSFEKEFATYLGVNYVVGVNSGTDGLVLALLALGIGKGDEVITPANSYVATTTAIVFVGAKPILVDCDPDTYQIDVKKVEKAVTKKTKAILPVHLYGSPAELDQLQTIANRYKLFLIEDACQAHGATFKNKKLGTFGDIGVFSFYPSKNLGAYGDGGALATNSRELYEQLLKLRNYGQVKKYHHDSFGINSRLDEMQAAVLRVKLNHLDTWNHERNEVAALYIKLLKNLKRQMIIEKGKSCYYLFVIETERRDTLQKYLLENGIQTLIHYPIPIHLQKAYSNLGYKRGDFPITEKVADRILSLPMYPDLKKTEINYISKAINAFIEKLDK
ncbi:DegT/DnrJ/EryC1/StrS family aminotransferase [soil metagenome]